jgi:hypothetical protein
VFLAVFVLFPLPLTANSVVCPGWREKAEHWQAIAGLAATTPLFRLGNPDALPRYLRETRTTIMPTIGHGIGMLIRHAQDYDHCMTLHGYVHN